MWHEMRRTRGSAAWHVAALGSWLPVLSLRILSSLEQAHVLGEVLIVQPHHTPIIPPAPQLHLRLLVGGTREGALKPE